MGKWKKDGKLFRMVPQAVLDRAVENYVSGMTQIEAGKMEGISTSTLSIELKKRGIQARRGGVGGKHVWKGIGQDSPEAHDCHCGKKAVAKYKGEFLCDEHLCGDFEPLRVEQFARGMCALADPKIREG